MKEKRSDYIVDRFVDEYGDERNFVLAAISYEFNEEDVVASDLSCGCDIQNLTKGVKLGYSICRPEYTDKDGVTHKDEFNRELGINIALGRARKNSVFALMSEYEGDINSDTVWALLERRAKYFKNNPETLIKGYTRKK